MATGALRQADLEAAPAARPEQREAAPRWARRRQADLDAAPVLRLRRQAAARRQAPPRWARRRQADLDAAPGPRLQRQAAARRWAQLPAVPAAPGGRRRAADKKGRETSDLKEAADDYGCEAPDDGPDSISEELASAPVRGPDLIGDEFEDRPPAGPRWGPGIDGGEHLRRGQRDCCIGHAAAHLPPCRDLGPDRSRVPRGPGAGHRQLGVAPDHHARRSFSIQAGRSHELLAASRG